MDNQLAAEIIRRNDPALVDESESSLRRKLRTNELTRVRPGMFVRTAEFAGSYIEERHAVTVEAATQLCGPGTVVSHASAAILHGLPVWGVDLKRVHMTKSRRNSGHVSATPHAHSAVLDDDEIADVQGFLVTSIARTLIDFARTSSFESGVVLIDAALNRNLVTPTELVDALIRAGRRHGCATAQQVLNFADGRSESVGESRSRVFMWRHGLPAPIVQYEIVNSGGVVIARSDFGFPDRGVVGEFDGSVKYGRLLKPGEDAGAAVMREKVREDQIRDEDLRVLRWIWRELNRPQELLARFDRAFAR